MPKRRCDNTMDPSPKRMAQRNPWSVLMTNDLSVIRESGMQFTAREFCASLGVCDADVVEWLRDQPRRKDMDFEVSVSSVFLIKTYDVWLAVEPLGVPFAWNKITEWTVESRTRALERFGTPSYLSHEFFDLDWSFADKASTKYIDSAVYMDDMVMFDRLCKVRARCSADATARAKSFASFKHMVQAGCLVRVNVHAILMYSNNREIFDFVRLQHPPSRLTRSIALHIIEQKWFDLEALIDDALLMTESNVKSAMAYGWRALALKHIPRFRWDLNHDFDGIDDPEFVLAAVGREALRDRRSLYGRLGPRVLQLWWECNPSSDRLLEIVKYVRQHLYRTNLDFTIPWFHENLDLLRLTGAFDMEDYVECLTDPRELMRLWILHGPKKRFWCREDHIKEIYMDLLDPSELMNDRFDAGFYGSKFPEWHVRYATQFPQLANNKFREWELWKHARELWGLFDLGTKQECIDKGADIDDAMLDDPELEVARPVPSDHPLSEQLNATYRKNLRFRLLRWRTGYNVNDC